MGKELEVHDLKVKDDAKIKHDLDVDGHLKVEGSLNFGRETYTQSALNASVYVNTASGIITTASATTALAYPVTINTFIVNSPRIKATSTVLLTIDGTTLITTGNNSTVPYISVSGITYNQFTINIIAIGFGTGSAGGTISIGYLIC